MHCDDDIQLQIVGSLFQFLNCFFSRVLKHCSAESSSAIKDNLNLLRRLRIIEDDDGDYILNVGFLRAQSRNLFYPDGLSLQLFAHNCQGCYQNG